jgi:hypothetical protein
MLFHRREWLRYTLSGLASMLVARPRPLSALAPADLTVYKSPTCDCCRKWVEHVRHAGLTVAVHDMENLSEIKTTFGVPPALRTCHTALVGKYVVEGHVPADLVRRLQKERPKILGLAVPGMPSGSPGMEGGPTARFDVIAFDQAGSTHVYATR